MSLAGKIDYRGQSVDIYDGNYNYDVSTLPQLNITEPSQITDVIQLFTVPSIRFFYLSKKINPLTNQKYILPYLANNASDIILWKKYLEQDFFNVTVYSQKGFAYPLHHVPIPFSSTSSSSSSTSLLSQRQEYREIFLSPETAFYEIIDGNTIISSTNNYLKEYIFRKLAEFGLFENIAPENRIYKDQQAILNVFVKGGFNPASDYLFALEQCMNPDEETIQKYLDEIGVITFSAKNIINLSPEKIFFYLVHFFGPPYENNLIIGAIVRSFEISAKTELALKFASQIEENYDTYIRPVVKKNFLKIYNYVNGEPDKKKAIEYLQNIFNTTYNHTFEHNVFDYLILFENEGFNVLSFKVLKQLFGNGKTPDVSVDSIVSTLERMYTDREIDKILPFNQVFELKNRRELITWIVKYWHENNIRLLHGDMSEVCFNQESLIRDDEFRDMNEQFIGYGSLQNNIYCYAIDDLFHHFKRNTNAAGHTEFTYPIAKTNMSTADLRKLKSLIESLPDDSMFEYFSETIPDNKLTKEEVLRNFDNYISQSELQSSAEYADLREIFNYAGLSAENRERIKNLFMAMFELGLYCRRWEGPGHPYPLAGNILAEPDAGTDAEVQLSDKVTQAILKFDNYMKNSNSSTLQSLQAPLVLH